MEAEFRDQGGSSSSGLEEKLKQEYRKGMRNVVM